MTEKKTENWVTMLLGLSRWKRIFYEIYNAMTCIWFVHKCFIFLLFNFTDHVFHKNVATKFWQSILKFFNNSVLFIRNLTAKIVIFRKKSIKTNICANIFVLKNYFYFFQITIKAFSQKIRPSNVLAKGERDIKKKREE